MGYGGKDGRITLNKEIERIWNEALLRYCKFMLPVAPWWKWGK